MVEILLVAGFQTLVPFMRGCDGPAFPNAAPLGPYHGHLRALKG